MGVVVNGWLDRENGGGGVAAGVGEEEKELQVGASVGGGEREGKERRRMRGRLVFIVGKEGQCGVGERRWER